LWIIAQVKGKKESFVSFDGGTTWRGGGVAPSGAGFAAVQGSYAWIQSSSGAAMGSDAGAVLWRSSDYGVSWSKVDTSTVGNSWIAIGEDAGQGMSFLNSTNGFIYGLSTAEGFSFLFQTHDGGRSWHHVALNIPNRSASSIKVGEPMFSGNRGLLATWLGNVSRVQLWQSQNGGQSWASTGTSAPSLVYWPAPPGSGPCVSVSVCWLEDVGSGGPTKLTVTTNAGQTWRTVAIPAAVRASFAPANLGVGPEFDPVSGSVAWVLAHRSSTLWKTTDEGAQWKQVPFTIEPGGTAG
jgi:hypothetical protein